MATVLVLDALQRKSLAVTRSLGAQGHRVLTADSTYFTICRYSRYATKSYVHPSPAQRPVQFMQWLEQLLARESIDALIATDDESSALLVEQQQDLLGKVAFLLPPKESFFALYDKSQTVKWLDKAEVAYPPTQIIRDLAELQAAGRSIGYPLVIKPRISSGSRGLRLVHNEQELTAVYQEVHRQYPWPIIQKYLTPGPKYHVCALSDQAGNLVLQYVQKELRQYPVKGGPSTMQESVDRPDLSMMLAALLSVLPWRGPLHADVMEDGVTGKPYVLEVNPRYWQSLHVAQRAGLDFASYHLALSLGQTMPCQSQAKAGIRGRSLIPFDLLAYLSDPDRSKWQPPFRFGYDSCIWDDLWSREDPGPMFGFLLAAARYALDGNMWRAVLRRDTW